MMGFERVAKLIQTQRDRVAPLAFMRQVLERFIRDLGRSAERPANREVTARIGFGSKAVVTGDITQVDLPNSKQSGAR